MNFKRKGYEGIAVKEGELPLLYFPILENTGLVSHGFTTRLGGVSEGVYASLSLGFNRCDSREHVTENYRRLAAALEVPYERMTSSQQTHTTNIKVIHEEDAGEGVSKPLKIHDIDGLVTNVSNIPLVTFYADCIPLFFLDPVHKAVGISHSGWRGTAAGMGPHTLEVMREEFGSRPEDILAGIGPGICGDCYEVGPELIEEFKNSFEEEDYPFIYKKGKGDRYLLNLWEANRRLLLRAGVRPEHLAVSDICTCCNPDLLFSHRASHGQRGNLCGVICLK